MKTKSVIEELEELVTELEVLPADALDEDIRMGERRRDRAAGCTQIEHGWMLEPDPLREIAASGMYFGNPIDLLSGTTRRTTPGTTASPTTCSKDSRISRARARAR